MKVTLKAVVAGEPEKKEFTGKDGKDVRYFETPVKTVDGYMIIRTSSNSIKPGDDIQFSCWVPGLPQVARANDVEVLDSGAPV